MRLWQAGSALLVVAGVSALWAGTKPPVSSSVKPPGDVQANKQVIQKYGADLKCRAWAYADIHMTQPATQVQGSPAKVWINVVVDNDGSKSAADVKVQVNAPHGWVDKPMLGPTGVYAKQSSPVGIVAWESRSATPPGTWVQETVRFGVDPTSSVPEMNKDNNICTVTFQYQQLGNGLVM